MRKAVREELTTLFTASNQFNQVFGYAPVDLNSKTKVLCIYSSDTRHDMISKTLNNNFYTFYLDVYVKRLNGEDVEDILDSLHETVRSVIRSNISNTNWDNLDLNDESECFFAEIQGVPYRMERHILIVKETQE